MSFESAIRSSRIDWLDIGKGLAILLVLIGHVLAPGAPATKALHDMIYNFHMGLFFFFAGCTASLSYRRAGGSSTFLSKKFHSIFIPYVAWCLLSPYFFAGELPEFSLTQFLHRVFIANYSIWFLPALLVLLVWFFLLKKLQATLSLQHAAALVALFVAGILALFAIHRIAWSFYPIYTITSAYTHVFPFACGALMFEHKRFYQWVTTSRIVYLLALILFVCGVSGHLPWLCRLPNTYYSQLIGVAASVALIHVLNRTRIHPLIFSQLSLFGKYTLIIYLAEGFWLPFWMPFQGWSHSLLIFAACFAISVPVGYICIAFAKVLELSPLASRLMLGKVPGRKGASNPQIT